MRVTEILRTLWRQRIFVVPATLVAALMCGFVVVKSPPTYRASGSVVLLNPPPLPQTQVGGPTIPADWQNPYTRLGDLSVVVDVLIRVLGSDSVVAKLAEEGFVGTPQVAGNRDYYSGPLIDVAAEAPDGAHAIADVNLLIKELGNQLERLQEGTVADYRIKSAAVISPDRATTVFSATLRLLLVAIALGIGLVVGVGVIADRARRGSRTARERAKASGRRANPQEPHRRRPARAPQHAGDGTSPRRAPRPRRPEPAERRTTKAGPERSQRPSRSGPARREVGTASAPRDVAPPGADQEPSGEVPSTQLMIDTDV